MKADVVIIGAGAAGLMSGIWALRSTPGREVIILDGAKKIGAKILVAGGGRCNVTHEQVSEQDYAGSTRPAVRKVLHHFTVAQTISFFAECGVQLKREATGKLFPTTDSSHTILNALVSAFTQAGGQILHPYRVEQVSKPAGQFVVSGRWGEMTCDQLILATGGKSLPKSGSDGQGYELAKSLGHSLTERILPALVPLTLPKEHFISQLSGLTLPTTLELWSGTGKKLQTFTNSTLCTHFGLSGPAVLDMSRYYLEAAATDPAASLTINWLPEYNRESFNQLLLSGRTETITSFLRHLLPERLARQLVQEVGVPADKAVNQLTKVERQKVGQWVTQCPLPISGNRGFTYAEVTAGGVPLSELNLKTMESRFCPGLFLCGEICDVDGRIGGFNFQWAWASGYTAGMGLSKDESRK